MRRVRKLAEPSRVCIGTWNVGLLMGKLREVVDTMIRWRMNILCVQQMKWKGQKAKEMLDKSLKDVVVDIKHQGDMIILVKLLVGDLVFNIISAYAPQIGLNEGVKMQFWEELDTLVSSVPIPEKLFIGRDLNGHVGSNRVGFKGVHGGFGYGSRNQEGGYLELCLSL
jgi:hypothetical protein